MPPRRPSQPRSVTRTSYQVGRPWMFDGKILRGLTGTPMRRIAFANNSFADAEPEPLTLANLTTKSLMASMGFMRPSSAPHACGSPARRCVISSRNLRMSQAPVGQRSAHRPQCRQTSSSLTMTLPVFSTSETYKSWVRFNAGAVRCVRNAASSSLSVKLMQSIGQMSTQASHSMQASLMNTVCTSQLRQRCASLNAVCRSKPSSTSSFILFSVFSFSRHGTT